MNHLKEVAFVFFKLGCIAFGGPAAHIAMMEKEIVEKRKWISQQHFLDLMGATNLIPGPNSTEMTMHCGHERAGWKGLFVAGICFIFPAVFLTGILAHLYVTYGSVPEIAPFFIGIKPAVLAIIMMAVIKLGKKALKNWQLGIIGLLIIVASFFDLSEVLCILLAGLIAIVWFGGQQIMNKGMSVFVPFGIFAASASLVKVSTAKIFLVFLKVGAVLFGSGYVLVAYLNDELVDKLGWLSKSELLDAIAIGQFTPGPVLSTSTFVGYQLGGLNGAIAATLGMFLPSFLFVWLLNPLVPKLRKSKIASHFLNGVNVGAVAIMLVVLFDMTKDVVFGEDWIFDWKAALIAIVGVIVTLKFKKISSVYIVLGGMILGYILYSFL